MHGDEEDGMQYKVVLNHEEQYSIWPADRDNAPGWRDEGKRGLKRECLEHINAMWTDMRPLSLRRHMEQQERAKQERQQQRSGGTVGGTEHSRTEA